MKKIIVISDSKQFTKTAISLVKELMEKDPVFLVGCFSHPHNYAHLIETSRQPYIRVVADLVEQDRDMVEENILLFEQFCHHEKINYRVHEEHDHIKIEHLNEESRFADLVVVNETLFTGKPEEKRPAINLRQILQYAECPTLLLPSDFNLFSRIAIAYDGRKESMFALKQFSYLFPRLLSLPAEIVYLSEEAADVPNLQLLREYISNNFANSNISKVHVDPNKNLLSWASVQKETLVVAGSYSRRNVTATVINSFIDPILSMKQLPVFISHP